MSTLHIVNQSPWRSDSWARCLSMLSDGDAVLLIEDAVYAVNRDDLPANCFVLESDLEARGLAPGVNSANYNLTRVDYAGFVDLACRYDRSVSWT